MRKYLILALALLAGSGQVPAGGLFGGGPGGTPVTTGTVTVSSTVLHAANKNLLGADVIVSTNLTSALAAGFPNAGLVVARYPGGGQADVYDWSNNRDNGCPSSQCCLNSSIPSNSSFANWNTNYVTGKSLLPTYQVNYGTTNACSNGTGGSTTIAANMVSQCFSIALAANCLYFEVGNEEYFSGGFNINGTGCGSDGFHCDLHSCAAAAVGSTSCYVTNEPAFYSAMHTAAGANTVKVGIPCDFQATAAKWDNPVQTGLTSSNVDFVDCHYYPETPPGEDDTTLLTTGPSGFTTDVNAEITRMQTNFSCTFGTNCPLLYVGEYNSVGLKPGKQTQSIVNALYMAMIVGEAENDGVNLMTSHSLYQSCNLTGNNDPRLYGWQTWGSSEAVSPANANCLGAPNYMPAAGTVLADGQALLTMSEFVNNAVNILSTSISPSNTFFQQYGATTSGGYEVALFNLEKNETVTVKVAITGHASGTLGTFWLYSRSIYDSTQCPAPCTWNGFTTGSLGTAWTGTFTVNLPPWSMEVIQTT